MVNCKYILSVVGMVLLFLCGCQVIPEAERLIPVEQELKHRVLLVECTGWRCPNCPQGAAIAHELLEAYPKNVVVVELHPSVNDFTKSSKAEYDFTSAAGDVYFASWGGDGILPALPSGVVNFTSGFKDRLAWATEVYQQLRDTAPTVNLKMTVAGDAATRELTVNAEVANGKAGRLLLWLVEDGIVAPQADGDKTVKDYVHNHILRGSLYADPWGVKSMDGQFEAVKYTVPSQYVWENVKVVGVLLDADSKKTLDVVEWKM